MTAKPENPRDLNPPAFPVILPPEFGYASDGMTLRDWFAGQALAGIMGNFGGSSRARAELAYQHADAMLSERRQGERND